MSKSQFKPQALAVFRQIERTGQGLVITDRGRPVLRIEPVTSPPDDLLHAFRGCVKRFDGPMEPVGVDDWEALGSEAP